MMMELPAAQYSQVAPLLDLEMPNIAVTLAVIEGHNPGTIWVDSLANPMLMLLVAKGGYACVGKRQSLTAQELAECVEILKQQPVVKLVVTREDLLLLEWGKAGLQIRERIEFWHPALMHGDTTHVDALCTTLPADCVVVPIDRALLATSAWLEYIQLFYGSEEAFLDHGLGLALMKKGEVLSEAFALYIGGHWVETGSVTPEAYRGRGYATLIRAFLIKELLARGLQPMTSCFADNLASARASQKLGFVEKRRYYFLMCSA